MLQNAYFLAKIGADTAENEQHFAEILPKIGSYRTGRSRPADVLGARRHHLPPRRRPRSAPRRRRRAAPALRSPRWAAH